jgi:putative nucleotidyltransferase with HDIG domain
VSTTTGASIDQLIDEITRIPVQPGAAMRLMRMLDDPRTSAESLGKVIESDPSLSARLIQLSNASFYGLSEPVSSAWRAVTVVGLATLRSVVATSILDIGTAEGLSVPDGFWTHAVATAAASGLVAPRVGVDPGEAFSAGLLHDVGLALVFRRARDRYDEMLADRQDGEALLTVELRTLGVDHCELGARAVAALGFGADAIEGVRSHHGGEGVSPFGAVLRAADVLAAMVLEESIPEAERDLDVALTAVNVAEHERQPLYQRVCELVDDLETLLGGA